MKILDVYDQDRNLTGKKILMDNFAKSLNDNEFSLMVNLAIFNEENEMLIHKRQFTKAYFPNLWDLTVDGMVLSGETSQMAIERNLFENLNYEYDFSNMIPNIIINNNKVFRDIYVITQNIDINNIKVDYDNVQSITWASKEEILQLIDEEKFVKYNKGFIELLFSQNIKRGVLD